MQLAPTTTCRWCSRLASQIFPHPAPADGAHVPQAAGAHDAEEPAAANKDATSPLTELHEGRVQTVIGEVGHDQPPTRSSASSPARAVYYDLRQAREGGDRAERRGDPRVEQLYPVPAQGLRGGDEEVPERDRVVWCQDEPANQGAWFFQHHPREHASRGSGLCRPPASASPAVGYAHLHQDQQKALLGQAFAGQRRSHEMSLLPGWPARPPPGAFATAAAGNRMRKKMAPLK